MHWTQTVKDSRGIPTCLLAIFCRERFFARCSWFFAYLIYFILFTIYAFVCFKPAHSSFGDREDIFVTHLIMVTRSEVSDIVIICFRGCVPDAFVPSYNVGFIFIREKLVLLLLLCSVMMRANDSVDLAPMIELVCFPITLLHYHDYADAATSTEILGCLSGTFCRVCV